MEKKREKKITRRSRRLRNISPEVEGFDDDFFDKEESYFSEDSSDEELESKDDELRYYKIHDHLVKSNPNIKKILDINTTIQNKAELLELYEVYKNMNEYTPEWLNIKNDLRDKLTSYCENSGHNKFDFAITNLNTTKQIKHILRTRLQKIKKMSRSDEEKYKLEDQLKWATRLPYNNSFKLNKSSEFLVFIKKELDKKLFGMVAVKEQLLIYLNMKIHSPNSDGTNLALVGSPGVGKTLIVNVLAEILNMPISRIFMGSVTNVEYIKGSGKVWVGTGPGAITRALCQLGVNNGIIYFDELSRIFNKPYVETSLIQLFDPIQNSEFDDVFMEDIPIDVSKIWFISSMNSLPSNKALRNRLFVINVPEYTLDEQTTILKDYILPKSLVSFGLSQGSVKVNKNISKYIINKLTDKYGHDGGARTIKKGIDNILRKILFIQKNKKKIKLSFNTNIKLPITLTEPIIDTLLT